jgi:hypothetical protein
MLELTTPCSSRSSHCQIFRSFQHRMFPSRMHESNNNLHFLMLAKFAKPLKTLYFILMGQRKTSVFETRRGPQFGVADKVN